MTTQVIDARTVDCATITGVEVTADGAADVIYRQIIGPTLAVEPWCRVEWNEADPATSYDVKTYLTEAAANAGGGDFTHEAEIGPAYVYIDDLTPVA